MFIDQIKNYGCAAIILVLLTVTVIARLELSSVQSEYKTYKDSINDQVQKAEIKKARIEAEQKAKYDRGAADYTSDVDRLNRIITGLRKSGAVPREAGVRVAGSSADSLPGKAEDTARTFEAIKATTRTGSFTYENAMMDTLQCKALIEFVSK